MYALPIRLSSRFHNSFAHGRVRVYRFNDLVAGSLQLAGGYYFGYHFGNVVADHVRAQEFAVFGIEDQKLNKNLL